MSGADANAALAHTIARQRSAADPNASAWVAANAGAGKTRVLVDRVLRLLLADAPLEKILCLTFTKAAAAEMVDRLLKRLGRWATESDEALREDLLTLQGTPFTEDLAKARVLFARALDAPGGAKIQTIHAFCESVLNAFPLEAGVPPHFRVADDIEIRDMRRTACLDAMRAANAFGGPALRAAATALAERFRLDDLIALANAARPRAGAPAADAVDALCAALGVGPNDSETSVIATYTDGLDRGRLENAQDILAAGSKADVKMAGKLAAALAASTPTATFDALRDLFLTQKKQPVKSLCVKATAEAHPALANELAGEQARFWTAWRTRLSVRARDAAADLQLFAAEYGRRLAAIKTQRAILDYDDLIEYAYGLFSDPQTAQWALYKLDGGIDHILVDEAQDTNPRQWDIIKAPLDEFFAGLGARETARTIFAVGDEKQSIYSFQGSDVAVFSATQTDLAEKALAGGATWRVEDLTLSFRSTPPILQFVDEAFADDTRAAAIGGAGAEVRHEARRAGAAGRVELWPAMRAEKRDRPNPWDAPLDRETADSPRARLAERIAQTVRGWLDAAEVLPSRGRAVRPGDILILVRRRDAFYEAMLRELKLRNVPVAGADRITLREDQAVQDLESLARFAVAPEDDLSLAEALRSPLGGVSEDQLFELAYDRKGSLWAALRDRAEADETWRAVRERFQEVRSRAGAPPLEFFSHALSLGAPSGRAKLYERLGAPSGEPLDVFLAQCLDYERSGAADLHSFLAWFETLDLEIKREIETSGDEARLMTVHGAKGLEAPIVFLPDTCKPPTFKEKLIEIDMGARALVPPAGERPEALEQAIEGARQKAYEEYLRLFYVAATRAEDRLYICGYLDKGRDAAPEQSWHGVAETALRRIGREAETPDGVAVLRLDSPQTDDVETETHTQAPPAPSLPAWARRKADAKAHSIRRRPVEAAPSPLDDDNAAARARGEAVHRLLEILPATPSEQREAAARSIAARYTARLVDADLIAPVLEIVNDSRFAAAFAPPGRAEATIAGRLPNGDAYLGRVDRLAIAADRIFVVDFKTGGPGSPDRPPDAYVEQLARYRAILREAFPGRDIAAAILWTDAPRLEPVAEVALDAAATRLWSAP